jgi:hypothetical protein
VSGKHRPIQCLIQWNLKITELDFLESYLAWKGIKSIPISDKSLLPILPPNEGECFVISQPNIKYLEDMRKNFLDTIVVGKLTPLESKNIFLLGYGKVWNELKSLNLLPLYSFEKKENSLQIYIFTGKSWLDSILKEIFETVGHKAYLPLQLHHLYEIIPNHKPDCIILNWDIALDEDRNAFKKWEEAISKSPQIPVLFGIKDFNRPGLAANLFNGISKFSNLVFTEKQLLQVIVNSFFRKEFQTDHNSQKDILQWNKPFRFNLKTIELISEEIDNNLDKYDFNMKSLGILFKWLLNDELFH